MARPSRSANQTTSFFLVSGFGSGAYSAKLLNGTRQRFSGFSQPRQCGDDVLRMLVTGGPPVRSGGGICPGGPNAEDGSGGGTRTPDPRIMIPVL
jgi:hypothetical protein